MQATVLNEHRIATLQWDTFVTPMDIGNFGHMMVEVAKNTDFLNDTIEELYPESRQPRQMTKAIPLGIQL
jgi:hypothetical protein